MDCVACQAPPSIGFSRQENWIGFPFSSPGDLPNLGIEPRSPTLQADSLLSKPPGNLSSSTVLFYLLKPMELEFGILRQKSTAEMY